MIKPKELKTKISLTHSLILYLAPQICERERCPWSVVGYVKAAPEGEEARVIVHDANDDSNPVDLELNAFLCDLGQKTFKSARIVQNAPDTLPAQFADDKHSVNDKLQSVLRLLSVGSKRFLTNKVDRSVSGLVAQQQCVGPLGLPLADCAVLAQSHLAYTGAASGIGEQPIKGLLDQTKMAKLTVAEALTNLVWAHITKLKVSRVAWS